MCVQEIEALTDRLMRISSGEGWRQTAGPVTETRSVSRRPLRSREADSAATAGLRAKSTRDSQRGFSRRSPSCLSSCLYCARVCVHVCVCVSVPVGESLSLREREHASDAPVQPPSLLLLHRRRRGLVVRALLPLDWRSFSRSSSAAPVPPMQPPPHLNATHRQTEREEERERLIRFHLHSTRAPLSFLLSCLRHSQMREKEACDEGKGTESERG